MLKFTGYVPSNPSNWNTTSKDVITIGIGKIMVPGRNTADVYFLIDTVVVIC